MRYQRLTLGERYQIAGWLKSSFSCRAIARQLKRSPSTISLEISRNGGKQCYHPEAAAKASVLRRKAIHPPYRIQGRLRLRIDAKLKKQWSPEQISGRFALEGVTIATETIYKYVYKNFRRPGEGLYLNLRRRHKRRRSHVASKAFKQCGKRLNYPAIKDRPAVVERRDRLGDYERDSVLGKFKGEVLLTIVDRCTRLTKLSKMSWLNADVTHQHTLKLLGKMPVHTITNDNGPEFADYKKTMAALSAAIFFNDPYSSWQRGTNENTNGLVRQYFPKGTDFSKVTDKQIKHLEQLLNNRPRKCLGYKTPNEVHHMKSQSDALSNRIQASG